jgi:DNA-binding CsgD family transcriptional regulator
MSMLVPKLNSHPETFEQLTYSKKRFKHPRPHHSEPPSLLQAIIEGFVDGVLILTEEGDWIHANDCARRICNQLSQSTSQINSVPQPIWHICESLIDSRKLFPDQRMIIEAELDTDNSRVFRVRVRWLHLDGSEQPYLLVTVEDRNQSAKNAALTEAHKYGLTPREAEVWLLRRANYSYKEIAAKLYITLNTVKKHMKSVYAKQQANLWHQEDQQAG